MDSQEQITGVSSSAQDDFLFAMQTEIEEQEAAEAAQVVAEEPTNVEADTAAQEQAVTEADGDRIAGKGGPVRDFSGIAQAINGDAEEATMDGRNLIQQASDAVGELLGVRSAEDANEERNEGIRAGKARGEELREADPAAAAVSDTLVRATPGAAIQMAETGLGAAEIAGDAFKATIAQGVKLVTFGAVAPGADEDGAENPFSDNYEWAKWKLGSDEIGAQTGTGKLAQNLIEFVGVGRRLGAFRSAQLGSATTKAGKAAQILKAGGKEAAYGMATDVLMSTKGEGNFANLLEQFIPGLKDTWVTALAIDEDDNPFEAAVKSALDGAALGFPVGVIGPIASTIRGVKNLPVDEQAEAFVELWGKNSPEEVLSDPELVRQSKEVTKEMAAMKARMGTPKPQSGVQGEIDFDALTKEGQLDLFSDGPMVRAAAPKYWDDAVEANPELFSKGAREVQPDFAEGAYTTIKQGGEFAIDPFTGAKIEYGALVNIDGAVLDDISPAGVQDFIWNNYDMLSREDVVLQSKISPITGKPSLELARVVDDGKEAVRLAKTFDQESVVDASTGAHTNMGGADALKETKGQHLKSAYTTPNVVGAADAKAVAKVQFHPQAAKAPQGALGGRLYTDAQIAQVARSEGDYVARNLDTMVKGIDVTEADVLTSSKMSQTALRNLISDDLSDFLDMGGRIDVSKLPLESLGGESILTRQSALQTRMLIKNISGRIWDEARMVNTKTGQNINAEANIQLMVDNLKALLRLHKRTANAMGTRLADYAIKLDGEAGAKGFKPSKTAKKTAQEATEYGSQVEGFAEAEKALDDIVKGIKSGDAKRVRQAQRTAQMLEMTGGDLSKVMKVSKGIPQLYLEVALKHMYNSLLSAPTTHVINNFSNFTNMVGRPLSGALGGRPYAAKAAFYNFGEMLSESMSLAKRTFDGETVAQGSKMVQNSEIELSLQKLAREAEASGDKAQQLHSGILNFTHDLANHPLLAWPSKFLTTSDEFFKAMNARMEFRTQSWIKAEELAATKPGSKTEALFKEVMAKNKGLSFGKSTGQVLDEDLLNVAKELTYQNDLEGWAGTFAKTVNDVPVLRPFFPFVKTGHNIMVYTGTHTPILNFALKESRQALSGDLGPYVQAIHRGRFAMGTTAMMTAAYLGYQGLITGSGPKDPQRRSEWMKTHQPRSIKVGDHWVSYDRIEPFGQILSAVADVQYAIDTGEMDQSRAEYLTQYLLFAISSNITDKTFYTGINDLAAFASPNGIGAADKALNSTANLANNFMPAAGMRRAVTNAMTPYMQEFHKNYDRVLRTTPMGTETDTADKIDWLDGEALTSASSGMWNALMPFKVVKRGSDPVRDALEEIEFETAEVRKELGGIDLTPEQQGVLNKYISETGIYDKIKTFVTRPDFLPAVEEYKKEAQKTGVYKENQFFYRHIKSLISQAQRHALIRLKLEYPDLAAQIDEQQRTIQAARQGSVGDLLNIRN